MGKIVLKNKPLVEAIFELRWNLEKTSLGFLDPNYKLIIGRMYEKLKEDYSYYEQLPAANIPDGMAEYIPQHRFRVAENSWPLIQIGHGILTVNDTDNYTWEDFEDRILRALQTLLEVYPAKKEEIIINRKVLRYVDSIEFNFDNDDVFNFLDKMMKTKIKLPLSLFKEKEINKVPKGFDLRFGYESSEPEGFINLRFRRGQTNSKDSLIWETVIRSNKIKKMDIRDDIDKWISEGHKLTSDWFFKLIDGELYRRFK